MAARFSPLVKRRIRRFFSAADEPDGVLPQVFAELALGGTDDARRTSAIVYRITTTVCLARRRTKPRPRALAATIPGAGHWLEASGEANDPAISRLDTTWRGLAPDVLEVAVYSLLDGMTTGQIAHLTDRTREEVSRLLDELKNTVLAQ